MQINKILICFLLFISLFTEGMSAKLYEGKSAVNSRETFDSYAKKMSSYRDSSLNKVIVETAKYFIGKPYVSSTLETGGDESLVVNLEEFDCTTFVETCIALSLTLKLDQPTYNNYLNVLTMIRYRDGMIDDYTSRLHYMCDWIYNNEKNGLLFNLSTTLGGKIIDKKINFMSFNSHLYKSLKENAIHIEKIKQIEVSINEGNNYTVIPKVVIPKINDSINDGDIIIFASAITGLDYSHMGIAYWQDGVLHFIHASSRAKKVIVEPKSLTMYCETSKQCTGISVLRLN